MPSTETVYEYFRQGEFTIDKNKIDSEFIRKNTEENGINGKIRRNCSQKNTGWGMIYIINLFSRLYGCWSILQKGT